MGKRWIAQARELARLAMCPRCGRIRARAVARLLLREIAGLAIAAVTAGGLWTGAFVFEHVLISRLLALVILAVLQFGLLSTVRLLRRARNEIRWL